MLIQEEARLKKQETHLINLIGHKGAEKKPKRKNYHRGKKETSKLKVKPKIYYVPN